MKPTFLIACLLIAFQVAHAQQMDCGPNPELNVSWSSNFKQATLHTACSASSTSRKELATDLHSPAAKIHLRAKRTPFRMNMRVNTCRQKIANQRAAIVATCGYYACKMSGTTASVANIAALSDVCSLALERGASSPIRSTRDFKVIPAFMPRVVTTSSQNVRVFVENLSNGILIFDRPIIARFRCSCDFSCVPSIWC